MARILFFSPGLNKSEGEVSTEFDRGWMLAGHAGVRGGGSTTLKLSEDVLRNSFLDIGRMVFVSHPKLPNWAGMIDVPWDAEKSSTVAVYDAEYILSLRTPENPYFLKGSVGTIAAQMIDLFNAGDDFFVRIGDVSRADPTPREETLDGQTYWEQLKALVERAGCELQSRSERDSDGRVIIYLDIAKQLGTDTGFLFVDGRDGNASFSDPVLDGPIINRVVGIGDESGVESRLQTMPFLNAESIKKYRMRSRMVQFEGVTELATLEQYAQVYLEQHAFPRFRFIMDVVDTGEAYQNVRLGNTIRVQAAKVRLPGGIRGWRGAARILAMAYTDADNGLAAIVETV